MAETKKNPVANKFALIYQFNNASPLFARVAADEIEKENLNKAIEILESGISLNPEYPTAYFIYAKALAITGNLDKAKEMVKKGNEFLNSTETEEYYLALVEELFEKSTPIKESRRVSFVDDDIFSIDENILEDEKVELAESETPKEPKFEDKLDDLANTLSTAKMKINHDAPEIELPAEPEPNKEEDDDEDIAPNMVSDTLAGIFLAQGKYKQARKIYKKLIEKQPEKMNLFAQKIAEIDQIIEEQG